MGRLKSLMDRLLNRLEEVEATVAESIVFDDRNETADEIFGPVARKVEDDE